jgi:hypothetical protein
VSGRNEAFGVHARVIQVLGNNSSLFRPVQKKAGIGSLLETQGTPHFRARVELS